MKRDYAVEIGRLVLLNFGPDAGKVALVLDIVDQNRVRLLLLLLFSPSGERNESRHQFGMDSVCRCVDERLID